MPRLKVDVNYLRGPTGSLLHSLDHPGGRILVLLFLVVIGCVAALFHIAWADSLPRNGVERSRQRRRTLRVGINMSISRGW
jgi:hypothetical protein